MKIKSFSKEKMWMRSAYNVWRKSFALLPCRVDSNTLVWLDYVERKVEQYWRGDNKKYRWVYREIMCPRAREALEAAEVQARRDARRAEFLEWGGDPEDYQEEPYAVEGPAMPDVGWAVAEPQGAMEPR